jgi:hypothetical protein
LATDSSDEIQEEFRRVASEHRALYEPGQVPAWLDKEAHASEITSRHRLGGGVGGVGHEEAADALALADRQTKNRWIFIGVIGLWGVLLSVAGYFFLRRMGFIGGRKRRRRMPGEVRTDMDHRY